MRTNADRRCFFPDRCIAADGRMLCLKCHRRSVSKLATASVKRRIMKQKRFGVSIRSEFKAVGLFSAPIKVVARADQKLIDRYLRTHGMR